MFKIAKKIKKIIIFIIIIFLLGITILGVLTTKYPIGYKSLIIKYSNEYNVDPFLIASVINVESRYDKDAISKKDAKGLMQIGPNTGKWASEVLKIDNYTEDKLFDPDINIRIGAWYLNTLFKEFNEDLNLVLAAYNAGSGNVNKWLADKEYCADGVNLTNIPFKETEEYLVKVENNYRVYSRLYKRYIMNEDHKDYSYIDIIHYIRKTIKEIIQ